VYLENGQSHSQNEEYLIIMILLKDIEKEIITLLSMF